MGLYEIERTPLRVVDSIAASDPDALYCIHPVSSNVSDGWVKINFATLLGAINRTALWIQENVAPSNEPETIAYVGANDIRYVAFIFACMRLRHTSLLLSTRNSEQASRHVLSATKATKIVYTSERDRQIGELKAVDSSLSTSQIPDLWTLFETGSSCPEVREPVDDAEDRVAVYIHSSGTTGMPKPVAMTNGYFQALEQSAMLPLPEGRKSSLVAIEHGGDLCFVMSPFFHLMGIVNMMLPILFRTPFSLCPERPLTDELLAQIVVELQPKTSIIGSSILEDLSKSELGMESLAKFDYIAYGGSPLAFEVGNRIAEISHLQSVLGTSECSIFPGLRCEDKADWPYLEFNPNAGLDMREAGDGLFELIVHRRDDRKDKAVFHTYPDKTEYRTGDLFSAHPTKKGLWLYAGRQDDLIVLSNGEKFNPTAMEDIIASHPLVSHAVVVGQGRFQSAAILEPNWSSWNGDPSSLIDDVWLLVKEANEAAPGYAQLMKERLAVSSQSKPFQLTPKGTIKRRAVVNDYSSEIDALYEAGDQINVDQLQKDASNSDIAAFITQILSDILGVPTVDQDADIFALGVDSLQTLRLGQMLQASLQTARPDLGAAFGNSQLYSRPTIAQLTRYVYDLLQGKESGSVEEIIESEEDREARIAALVGKYSDDVGESHAVILTGSTGSLGAYLLHELLRDLSVSKIYCLNRSDDAAPRQLQSLREKGLATFNKFPRRVEFLQARFGDERLGLDEAKYEELLENVDTIIHNAWKVNFNHQVEAFEQPHIQGVRRLVDFSISSEKRAHIHFISSISTIEGYSHGPSIPEIIFNDPSSALRQGYGESKHVSERICAAASAKCGIPTSIHRVGQIGGPTTEQGMWNKQEWVPSLVATSKTIKQIPDSLGSVSVQWVPVDITAKVITDIVRTRRTTQEDEASAAFHIVNPRTADWKSLIPAVTKYCEDVEPVDVHTWIKTLESFTNPTESDLKDKPALKILDFFKAITFSDQAGPSTETTKTQAASKTLRDLKEIDASLFENWMRQWNF
ncbi:hypothetical protein N7532_009627 [Penicillium argentinense]|uniref:Carrier domain-containing protein n=1 Tax=Penicillium argentinense TaxID=1131581 RepID=A0A9W9K2R7_9EURO|nr:uncharacterized protein N7532_009627 [Penicillium argentinense]KAJ5090943.1 hypothetical protein N7532_009627 [Penicillium argentinense]